MMCIDLKDIWSLTFMVYNFCFVLVLFPLELLTSLFCMTLLFEEYAKRILSLTIAIHEFFGSLMFPKELQLLGLRRFIRFVMILLRSMLIAKNYFNGLFEGFWILIMHYPTIVQIRDAIDISSYQPIVAF